jgi:glycosyltransferase involved in cell wall biosynthesis
MQKICIISSVHQALDNRIFYREAYSLIRAGYQVTVVAHHSVSEIKDGVQIFPLPGVPRWQRPLVWMKLLKLAISTQSDLYHFHDPELLLVAPYFRFIANRPTIYDIHESTADFLEIKEEYPRPLRAFLAWLLRWLEPALAGMQSGLIFADDQIAEQFSDIQKPKTTLFNFPNKAFIESAIEATKNIQERQSNVIYLGGIKRGRGIDLMMNAFEKVYRQHSDAHLMLVGPFAPASLENEIRNEINQRGLANAVTITGPIPFENTGEYLINAVVGWIPFPPVTKYQKNIPTKLFEYMAYALPVVSSDLSPIQPFISNDENGYLVPANDADAHAEAILRLLTDPEQASALGKCGQELVYNRYTWDEMEERLYAIYKTLLDQ